MLVQNPKFSMKFYYILISPWAVYVKDADFFEKQGGLVADWGRDWRKIRATSIENARECGETVRELERCQALGTK